VDGDVTVDPAKVEPKQLCELGGEKISVPLSVQCRKKGNIDYFERILNNIFYRFSYRIQWTRVKQ
jgi:hypothetical protein